MFGRADLSLVIPGRILPSGTKPSRLVLDIMVAPDGAGERAVVSAFVNERLLASTVAAIGEPTRLDFALPAGLVGTVANLRTVVQRRSSQGDCRFEPQGYPAEILGSSSVVLTTANRVAEDFSDLAPLWADGVEMLLPASTATKPLATVRMLAGVLGALSKETAPITVKYVDAGNAIPTPSAPFIAVGKVPPAGREQHVRFDRGRVAVTDRAGGTKIDLGGLFTGAVAQIVTSGTNSGVWIKPLASDGVAAGVAGGQSRSRRCRLPRQNRRGAGDVHAARHAASDFLCRPGHRGSPVVGPFPLVDRRRLVGVAHFRAAVRAAENLSPPDAAVAAANRSGHATALAFRSWRSATFSSPAACSRLPQLDEARGLAETWHVRLGDAILSRNWAEPNDLLPGGRAIIIELPFVDLIVRCAGPCVAACRRNG